MDFNEAIAFASQRTNIIRARKNPLYTFGATRLPYVCLSDSARNTGDVVLRRGEVTASRPSISVPGQAAEFEGFDFGGDKAFPVFLARQIEMPIAKYINKSEGATDERGPLEASIEKVVNQLDRDNDIRTAVLVAPDNVWTLSVLLYIGSQVVRSAPANIAEALERMKLRGGL
jgi:hypothetical protein